MIKKIIKIITLLLSIIVLTACSKNTEIDLSKGLSEKDLTVVINNVTYKYPWDFNQFKSNDYYIYESLINKYNNYEVKPGEYTEISFHDKTSTATVDLKYKNYDNNNSKKVKDCTLVGINFYNTQNSGSKELEFSLPLGIKYRFTRSQILNVLGNNLYSDKTYRDHPSYNYMVYNYDYGKDKEVHYSIKRYIEDDYAYGFKIEIYEKTN